MGKLEAAAKTAEKIRELLKSSKAEGAASKVSKTKLLDFTDLEKQGIKPDMRHLSEDDAEYLGIPWEDTEYNYRLNYLPTKKFLVKDGKVVGHIGLDDSDTIKAAYVNAEQQGEGFGTEMYKALMNEGYPISSDDAMAMEPGAKAIWEKLHKERPDLVYKKKNGYGFDPDAGPKKTKYMATDGQSNDNIPPSVRKKALAGTGAVSMASPTLKNPADLAKDAYSWYVDKLKQGGDLVADKVLETTTPQGLPDREKFIEGNKEWVSEGAQFVGDPLNLVAGAGGLLKAKRAAKAVEGIAEAAKVADKATDASKAVEAAKAVEGMGEAVKAERGIKPMNIVKPSPEQINATIESLRNPKRVAELRNKVKQMRDLSVPQSAAQTPEQLATIRQRLEASKPGFAEAERKIALTPEQRMAEMTPHQRQLYEEQLKREAADTARLIEQEKAAVAADNAPEKLRAEVDARKQRISDDTVSVPVNLEPVKSSINDDIVQQILKRKQGNKP